ncbi:sure-like protein [Cystobasidium minutum MCA 4210]|uniref:sure-like protein n=1 Tax=Cystobasidium minutum MCA 4210 TaxID=1397322 RepID=UPI0034D0141D|eukprot:jgi/Rhomi1/9843/CE9842_16766
MRFSIIAALLAASTGATLANLNIILTNDDSWVSANIRATKTALEASGHKVLLLGPLDQQSGKGGTVVLPTTNVSAAGGKYGFVPEGAPYYGYNESDTSLRYFNGTPAAVALWGLNDIDGSVKSFFGGEKVHLVCSGPNEGNNLGPFLYTLSGTVGAAYASIEYGVPAVAFSAGNSTQRPYTDINYDDPYDPAVLGGKLVAGLVDALADGWDKNGDAPLLPPTIGLNVNFPVLNSSCSYAPYTLSRLTGGAYIDGFKINDAGFPTYTDIERPGLNTCVNGDCSLPGETDVVESCQSSISVFSTDYDAPTKYAQPVQEHVKNNLAKKANKRMKRDFNAKMSRPVAF